MTRELNMWNKRDFLSYDKNFGGGCNGDVSRSPLNELKDF